MLLLRRHRGLPLVHLHFHHPRHEKLPTVRPSLFLLLLLLLELLLLLVVLLRSLLLMVSDALGDLPPTRLVAGGAAGGAYFGRVLVVCV